MSKNKKSIDDYSIEELKSLHSDSVRMREGLQSQINQVNSQIQTIIQEITKREDIKSNKK